MFQKSGRQVLHSTGICKFNSFKFYSASLSQQYMYHKAYGLKYKSIKLSKQLIMNKEAKYEKKALKSHQFRKENSFLRKVDMKFLPTNRASCQKFCSFFLGCPPFSPNSILIHFTLTIQDLSNHKLSYYCFLQYPRMPITFFND